MSQENPAEFTSEMEAELRAIVPVATAKHIFDSTAALLIPLIADRNVSEETKKAVLRVCCDRILATLDGDADRVVQLQKDGIKLLIERLGQDYTPEFDLQDIL